MLAHQLPSLPPYESFWDELPAFFDWLTGGIARAIPAAYAVSPGEEVLRHRDLRLPLSGASQSVIEIIRFAAGIHLLVELDYQGNTFVSGERVGNRFDAAALGLVPLALEDWGPWDPQEE